MLRITIHGADGKQRWTLCGQLAGPWVDELRANWKNTPRESRGRSVIDLSDVTFIDEDGESALREMRSEGAELVGSGVETKDLLENLQSTERRPLRRFLAHMAHDCGRKRS